MGDGRRATRLRQDTSGLNLEVLARCLRSEYETDVSSLVFFPKGEDSHNFVVESESGERFVARLQQHGSTGDFEHALRIAATLRDRGGLRSIVSACPTVQGTLTAAIESYRVALFPYAEGETAYVRTVSDRVISRLGSLLAEIHACADLVRALNPPRETFENPFRRPISGALAWAHGTSPPATRRQHEVRRLLLSEASDLTDFMDGFDDLGHRARSLDQRFVISHGDPNLDNVIVSPDGGLHLVDWGEVALGPRERDLSSYASDRLDVVLRGYFEAAGTPTLHADLFGFYRHRWCLQEIADYTTRIMFTNAEVSEDEHAWAELQPYLPIRRNELAAGHERTADLLSDLRQA